MTNEEKLKLVAEYMEYPTEKTDIKFSGKREIFIRPIHYNFDSDYQEQIPVWQKVWKEFVETIFATLLPKDEPPMFLLREEYHRRIDNNSPLDSFEILVQAIELLNQIKNK